MLAGPLNCTPATLFKNFLVPIRLADGLGDSIFINLNQGHLLLVYEDTKSHC